MRTRKSPSKSLSPAASTRLEVPATRNWKVTRTHHRKNAPNQCARKVLDCSWETQCKFCIVYIWSRWSQFQFCQLHWISLCSQDWHTWTPCSYDFRTQTHAIGQGPGREKNKKQKHGCKSHQSELDGKLEAFVHRNFSFTLSYTGICVRGIGWSKWIRTAPRMTLRNIGGCLQRSSVRCITRNIHSLHL